MMHMLLIALAQLAQFDINFIAVINAISIYCQRNTLKQYVSKTVDEFCLWWNNKKKTIFCNYDSNAQCTPNYLQEGYSSAHYSRWYFKSCFGNIYWQNISFIPIEKRRLLESITLCYDSLLSLQYLITHFQVLKFHIDQITDQCAFRVMIFGHQKYLLIYFYCFLLILFFIYLFIFSSMF